MVAHSARQEAEERTPAATTDPLHRRAKGHRASALILKTVDALCFKSPVPKRRRGESMCTHANACALRHTHVSHPQKPTRSHLSKPASVAILGIRKRADTARFGNHDALLTFLSFWALDLWMGSATDMGAAVTSEYPLLRARRRSSGAIAFAEQPANIAGVPIQRILSPKSLGSRLSAPSARKVHTVYRVARSVPVAGALRRPQ